jgi:hypothetical protein
LVEWTGGNLWQYKLFVDGMTGRFICTESNVVMTLSGLPVMVMAPVTLIDIDYLMFVNCFAKNTVKTT